MPTDKTLTDEELDAIESMANVCEAESRVNEAKTMRGILDRHRPKPTLPDAMEVFVWLDRQGKPWAGANPVNECRAIATPCTVYPNPSVMLDPVTLSVEHGLTVERYSVCFRIYSSERRQLRGDFPLSRDGYHAALRKATEMASQRSA